MKRLQPKTLDELVKLLLSLPLNVAAENGAELIRQFMKREKAGEK